MGPSTIVVGNPLAQNPLEMTFAEWDQEVQAFSPNRADQAFTEGIGLGCSNRRLQNTGAETLKLLVRHWRKDRIPVMDEKTVGMVVGQKLAELLRGPLCGRMLGDVTVKNTPRADLHAAVGQVPLDR